jgi:hypothetical protein
MCPLCIITAIVLGTSAAAGGGLNWLKAKFGQGNESGEVCQLFPQGESNASGNPIEAETATRN